MGWHRDRRVKSLHDNPERVVVAPEVRALCCGRGVVVSGVEPHAGSVRERFGWKAKATEEGHKEETLGRYVGGAALGFRAHNEAAAGMPRGLSGRNAAATCGGRGVVVQRTETEAVSVAPVGGVGVGVGSERFLNQQRAMKAISRRAQRAT